MCVNMHENKQLVTNIVLFSSLRIYLAVTARGLFVSGGRHIHLLAADSVVSASPLPAYFLPGQLFIIVPFDPDSNHARFVHYFLNNFAVFANDFACCERERIIG